MFTDVDDTVLRELAAALETGGLTYPPTSTELSAWVDGLSLRRSVAKRLETMAARGFDARQTAVVLAMILEERAESRARAPKVDAVWSGLDVAGMAKRAAPTVRALIREARERIWISTYNVDDHAKSGFLFDDLAARLDAGELAVRFYLNIARGRGRDEDWEKPKAEVLAAFGARFRDKVWPGEVLPEVYYDPRPLENEKRWGLQSVLHAKCMLVDERVVYLTSANFSEAAQVRNIEAGVVVEDAATAKTFAAYFARLVDKGYLERLVF